MQKVVLQYKIVVSAQKRRELLLMFEREMQKELPQGCLSRNLEKSVAIQNQYSYREEWENLLMLESYIQTKRYRSLFGGIYVLSISAERSVIELNPIEYALIQKNLIV